MIGRLKKGETPYLLSEFLGHWILDKRELRLMVNEQERESSGTIFCLKQDEPLINYCKFLNTSVQCLKKRHKEISVCNDSALLVVKPLIEFQEGEWPLLKSWLWLVSKKLERSFKKHRTRRTVGLDWL